MSGGSDSRLVEECAGELARAGMELLARDGEIERLRGELARARSDEGTEDGRRAVAAAVDAVLEAAAGEGFRRCHGDRLLDLLWWLASTGRRNPRRVRALWLVRTRLGGVVRRGAAAEIAPDLGCDERTARRHLAALRADPVLRACVVWQWRDEE